MGIVESGLSTAQSEITDRGSRLSLLRGNFTFMFYKEVGGDSDRQAYQVWLIAE